MSSESRQMKVAKASKEDFETTRDFLQIMDDLFDSRGCFCKEEDWLDWDDDNPDKIRLLEIRKEVAEETGYSEDDVDNDLILFNFIKEKFRTCEFNWRRVLWAGDVLIFNACDPHKDHLAYHPYINRCMSGEMLGADSNEFEMEEDEP